MAEFTPSKKTAQDFNNGIEYINEDVGITGDALQAETINNLVESALYTQEQAENAVSKSNEALDKITAVVETTFDPTGNYPNMTVGGATNDSAGRNISGTFNKNLYNLGAFDTVVSNGNGTATITRRTGYLNAKELTNMSWLPGSISTISTLNFYTPLPTGAKREIAYSNLFKGYATVGNDFKEGGPNIYVSAGENLNIYPAVALNSVDEFKQWLSSNEFSIQFELAESYTETVIENQPIHTLPQDGEQWVRKEWGKGLNLIDGGGNLKSGTIYYDRPHALNNPGTYTIQINTQNRNGAVVVSVRRRTDNAYIREINADVAQSKTFDWTIEDINNDHVIDIYSASTVGTYQIMLNEGSHPYPYQPYNGGIVREKELSGIQLFPENINPAQTIGGDWLDLGVVTVGDATLHAYQKVN